MTAVPWFIRRSKLLRPGISSPKVRPSRNAARRAEARRRHAARLEASSYLPGLDGLRALAVLGVLVYHARPHWLPGGFLGVEVFFVISGFIITRGLLHEWQETGRISLRAFWLRRARRLLPALFLLLAGVMAYAAAFEPEAVTSLRGDALAALGYATNWHLIAGGQSYFESFEKPSLLLHLWSLAIEEQFYLLWPLLLAVCLPLLRKRATFALVVAGVVASAAAMALLYRPDLDAARVYYGTDTRAAALLTGAGLAFVLSNTAPGARPQSPRPATVLAVAALGGLILACFALAEDVRFLYRGGFLGVSLLSAALITGAVRGSPLSTLLGWAPLRWAGVRSYGIYLWHWPIFLLTWPEQPGLGLLAAEIAATVAIAALSYRFLETPVRQGALSRLWGDLRGWPRLGPGYQTGLVLGGSAAAALVAALVLVAASAAPPQRPDYYGVEAIRIRGGGADARASSSLVSFPASRFVPADARRLNSLTCPEGLGPHSRFAGVCGGSQLVSVEISDPDVPTPVVNAHDAALADISTGPETGATSQKTAQAGGTARVEDSEEPAPLKIPERRTVPADLPMVTAIGDSVMLGAAPWLAGSIPNIDLDSEVGRQASSAISLLQERAQDGQLGQIVLVHIGNNGTLSAEQFDRIMAIVGPERQVIFLNTQVPRPWRDSNNAVLSEGAGRHANVYLIDWHAITEEHPELFAKDHTHLNRAGAELYTRLVIEALLG